MFPKKKFMIAYASLSVLFGIGLAIFRTIMLYRYYDPYDDEFSIEAASTQRWFNILTIIALLLLLSSYFVLRKAHFEKFAPSSNQFSVFSSSLCGFVFLAIGILLTLYYSKELFAAGTGFSFFRLLTIISFFLLFLSALYFIISASVTYTREKTRKLLSFAPTLWALVFMVTSYINPDYLYRDPNRILCIISLASLLLFFLMETRNTVSTPVNAARFAISLIAMVCILSYILPLLITTAFWEVSLTKYTLFEAIECGAVLYILATINTMIHSYQANPTATEEAATSQK